METPEISRIYALIPDSGLEIQNRCTETQQISLIYASIRKSGLEIKNRCTETPEMNRIFAVSMVVPCRRGQEVTKAA